MEQQQIELLRERMRKLLEQGEKITLKQWKAKIQSLQADKNVIDI